MFGKRYQGLKVGGVLLVFYDESIATRKKKEEKEEPLKEKR